MEKVSKGESGKQPKQPEKRKSSRDIRISSSGRYISTPKHLQTSSSDEQPRKKKTISSKNLKAEIERLKSLARKVNRKETEKEHVETSNALGEHGDRSESSEKDSGNTNISTFRESTSPVHRFSVDTLNSVGATISDINFPNTQFAPPSEKAAKDFEYLKAKYAGKYRNGPSSIALSMGLDLVPESDESNKNLENISSETYETRNPLRLKPGTTENSIDELFGETSLLLNFKKYIEDKLTAIEGQNRTVIEQNREILKQFEKLSPSQEKLGNTLYEPLKGFPMNTIAQFEDLDCHENKDLRNRVHAHLLHLGGSKLREFLACGLKEIMTDELVTKFTWNKSSDTHKLGDTRVSNILYQAAIHCPLFQGPENKNIFKTEMLQVLRVTKQRFRNAEKKSLSQISDVTKELERTEEGIQKKISRLEEMMLDSDADDEEEDFDDNELENDEQFF